MKRGTFPTFQIAQLDLFFGPFLQILLYFIRKRMKVKVFDLHNQWNSKKMQKFWGLYFVAFFFESHWLCKYSVSSSLFYCILKVNFDFEFVHLMGSRDITQKAPTLCDAFVPCSRLFEGPMFPAPGNPYLSPDFYGNTRVKSTGVALSKT